MSLHHLIPAFSLLLLFLHGVCPSTCFSGDLLDNPLYLGAYLYQGKCTACHGKYNDENIAAEYDSVKELTRAIGHESCSISWSKRAGGELGNREIRALAFFMLQWEQKGRPDIPPLPSFREEKILIPTVKKNKEKPALEQQKQAGLPSHLRSLLRKDQIAQGGYLYVQHCYRCHLDYHKSRMGRSTTPENLRKIISEGKTSTQMKPFSRMLGGELKKSEIEAIANYILLWEQAGEELAIAKELVEPPAMDPSAYKPLRLMRFAEVRGNREIGGKLFEHHCGTCHGKTGQGNIGPSLHHGSFGMRPDLFIRSVLKKGVPASPMKPVSRNLGGALSNKEIDDIVIYVIYFNQPWRMLHGTIGEFKGWGK